ncbi:hypothetical protein D9M71_636090 [compost metagenome]
MLDVQCSNGLQNFFGNLCSASAIGVGKQHRELLSTVSDGQIPRSLDRLLDRRPYGAQAIITGSVPIAVVVALEVIDIEHDQRQRGSLARSQANLFQQRSIQASTIAQARQAVGQRHLAHGLMCVTQLSFRHHSLAQLTQDDEAEHREHPDQDHQHPPGFK